jgi:hypothetical protein
MDYKSGWEDGQMLHFALVVAGGLAFAGPAEADTRRFTIGPWSGDAFVIDKRFSHCGALALYNSGVAMMFIVTRRYQWAVGFASDKFSFEEGKTYKLALSLDGDEPTIVTGRAIGNDTIRIDLAPTAELFNKFRRGGSLRLSEQRASYTFDLTDTSKVLPALVQCVNASLNPTPMQTAQLAPHARPTAGAAARARDNRAEATAIVANLLSRAGVRGFQITPAGQDEIGWKADVAWTAEKVSGALFILEDPQLRTPSDTTPVLIALMAQACKGTFLSGALPDEGGGVQQTRVFTNCKSANSALTVYFLTIARRRGGHYVFATTSAGVETPAKEADASIRSAVLRVLPK